MGDAVYEQFIREYLLRRGSNVDRLNYLAIRFVCAGGQAHVAKTLVKNGFLTEEEEHLLKRGRNHTSTSKPRGASPMEYKWATGFEALLGYLHLAGETDRIAEITSEAFRIIEE